MLRYPRAMDDNAARHASEPGPDAPAVPGPRTDRTRIRRYPDRAVPERIEEFLRAGLVAHIACVEDGEPRVIPFLYHYEAGHIYLHGSAANATLRLLRDGRSVAVAVSEIVDLIASKSASGHTANYRSVVAYGHGRPIADFGARRRVLEAMIARYFPGRAAPADYAPASDQDLAAIELIDIEIDEASAKLREGGSLRPEDDDPNHPGSAFVRPL